MASLILEGTTVEEFTMKKLLQMMRHLFLMAVLLFINNNIALAASIIDIPPSPFDKIPPDSPFPTIPDIVIPPFDIPFTPSCNQTFPEPELFFTGKTERTVNGEVYINYSLAINNKEDYPDYLFAASPSLPPCGLNNEASRTWELLYDENDDYIYGFCALSSASQLDGLWFSHKKTDPAPGLVYVVLQDRLCNKEYKSAPIALEEITVETDAPVIAGIGLVPRTFINQTNGLATTGPGHPINVMDAPFGKSLRFMGNLDRLRSMGITQYAIGYCDMDQHGCNALFTSGFDLDEWKFVEDVRTNYFWSTVKGKYILQRESPAEIYNDGTYIIKTYPVPSSSLTLYFENLLFDWVTHGAVKVPSSQYKVHLFGFSGPNIANLVPVPSTETTMVVRIDNTPPVMAINSISYKGSPVSACSIVNLENAADSLEFNITATDPDGYLFNYVLKGEYGDNQTLGCVSENYAGYLADGNSGPVWDGASPSAVYSCDGFPVSCAYSYHISGWDRAINGYNRIHYVDYFKTLTIQLP